MARSRPCGGGLRWLRCAAIVLVLVIAVRQARAQDDLEEADGAQQRAAGWRLAALNDRVLLHG